MSYDGDWIDAGTDAFEAQRKRKQRLALNEFNRLGGKDSAQSALVLPDSAGRIPLAAAEEKYFSPKMSRPLAHALRRHGLRASCFRVSKPAGFLCSRIFS